MEDSRIVELYWIRDESAIAQTQEKYGRYCHRIAMNILQNSSDAEESVNDTYIGAWNAIPPYKPAILSTFLGKITRRIALKKRREQSAEKRGGGEIALALEELEECVSSGETIDEHLYVSELTEIINQFLEKLPDTERRVFLRRYWYFDSIADIASRYGFGESKVKMMLKRTRDKLEIQLKKEGILI